MKQGRSFNYIFIIIALCYLSRLPYLLDASTMLDGDESVVALMAKHALQGKELPIFFWGQDYGFSLVEVLFILPFYAVLGVSTIAVKLGMLSLWTIGVVFLYKTMTAIDKGLRPFALILTLVLIFSPAWYIWSMKARGGYLTAFTLTSIVLYLVYTPININKYLRYILVGALTYLIYESQLFWLVGLLPLLLYQLLKEKQLLPTLSAILSMAGMFGLFLWIKSSIGSVYTPPRATLTLQMIWDKTIAFPEYVYKTIQGNYYFSYYQPTNGLHTAFAKVFTVVILLLFLLAILHLIIRRKGFGLFIASTVFIPLTLAYTYPSYFQDGRYLLPITGFALLSVYIYTSQLRPVILLYVGGICLTIIGLLAVMVYPVRFQHRSDRKDMEGLISRLQKENIHHVYSTETMLAWEIMFYSNEDILSRTFYFPGRYPKYDTAVDKALYTGARTAVFGWKGEYAEVTLKQVDHEDHYFLSLDPTKQALAPSFYFPLHDSFFHNKGQ